MTTSDLVARLTARANLTYSYPIEDILLLRGAADELDRLNAEIARLREALQNILDVYGDDLPGKMAQAALAEKEEK